jgi:hypothetical protein
VGLQKIHEHEALGGGSGRRLHCRLTSLSRSLQINLRINLDGTVFSLGFVIVGRSFLPVGVEKGQSISRLPFWMGIKFYCVLFYLTLIVLTLYLNGIFHHHYSIIVLIADCTALYLPSFECAAKQVIKYAFPSFSYRTTML